jgi:hypothetical protein
VGAFFNASAEREEEMALTDKVAYNHSMAWSRTSTEIWLEETVWKLTLLH